MSNQLYNVNVPTSVEPANGFVANDRIVFKMNFPMSCETAQLLFAMISIDYTL